MTTMQTGFEPRMSMPQEAPDQYRAMVALDRAIEFDPALRELIKIRASQVNGCAYCIWMHTTVARKAGETEQRIYALSAWQESPLFSDRERVALALTEAITLVAGDHVPDDVYEAAREEFGDAELAQLVWAIVAINAWNRMAITVRSRPGS